ncbi:hypothetical protein ABID95_008000 [Streptomyces atratus]|uniref:hypothetical protein n=1 Tax=Streptomyces atratus TaxID=1893 RepID=UPI0033969118
MLATGDGVSRILPPPARFWDAEVDGRPLVSALRFVALGTEEGEGEVDAFDLTGPALSFGACSAVEEVGLQLRETGQHLGVDMQHRASDAGVLVLAGSAGNDRATAAEERPSDRPPSALEQQGEKTTHAALARSAGVSTWLTCTEGVREHIEAAQQRQQPKASQPADTRNPNATLRTELELARQEIRALREERERMRQALQHQLGQQLDTFAAGDLTARVDELTQSNQPLTDQIRQAIAENNALQRRLTAAEADLTAARTSLRRMIRTENMTR